MAKVIEFYVSDSLLKKSSYITGKEPGKLIEFGLRKETRLAQSSAQWPAIMAYMHHLLQTLRAVQTGTPSEQDRERGGRS